MPIQINQHLIDDLVKRQMAQEQYAAPQPDVAQTSHSELSPSLLAILGGAADGISTFDFLRKGTGVEDNAMYRPLKGNPIATGLAVAGTGALTAAVLKKVLGKKFPKITDALLANQGADRIALAARNFSPEGHTSSSESYNNSITQAIRRTHGQ